MTARAGLLPVALRWIGVHFQNGDSQQLTWENATRAALDLPTAPDDDPPLIPEDFTAAGVSLVHRAFRELAASAQRDEPDDDADRVLCAAAVASILPPYGEQPDLSSEQRLHNTLAATVAALQFWLMYTPGGLAAAAAHDLTVAATDGDPDRLNDGGRP